MKPDKQILLSVGVLIEADAPHERLEAIGIAMRDAVTRIAEGAGAEASTVINWDYLGTESANSIRCCKCGCWASDVNEPDKIACITLGHWIDGKFYCTQCRLPPRT